MWLKPRSSSESARRFCVACAALAAFFALCAVTAPVRLVAQPPTDAEDLQRLGVSSQRLALLSSVLEQHVADGRVAGLVAGMMHRGKLVYLRALGSQVVGESAMREDSLFQIRSMSKPITAVAALQLVERGVIGLDDPVADYIPSFADARVFTDPKNPDLQDTRAPTRARSRE